MSSPTQLLSQVLCGDRPPDDPEFARALRDDAGLRDRWQRLSTLSQQLDALGSSEREARRALSPSDPELEQRVTEQVRAHFLRTGSRPRRVRWTWGNFLATVLAAGLVASLLPALWHLGEPDPPRLRPDLGEIVLGTEQRALGSLRAVELGERTFRLDWADAEAAFGRTYLVRIHSGAAGVTELVPLGSAELLETAWTLEVPEGLDPRDLTWSVVALDADRNPVAESSRRSLSAP